MRYLLIVLLFTSISMLFSETQIPGGDVSGHWTVEGSPYIINATANVPVDSCLIIDPGVSVFFTGEYGIIISGKIIAIGTETDSIKFMSQSSTGWWGLAFNRTNETFQDSSYIHYIQIEDSYLNEFGKGINFLNSSKISFKNIKIENSVIGLYLNETDSLKIENVQIINCSEKGIFTDSECNDIEITNCNISECNTGVDFDYGGINYYINNSRFSNCLTGIRVSYCDSLAISNSFITDSDSIGIYIEETSSSIDNVEISGNGCGVIAYNDYYEDKILELNNSIIHDNEFGVYLSCDLITISNSTFFNNSRAIMAGAENLYFFNIAVYNNHLRPSVWTEFFYGFTDIYCAGIFCGGESVVISQSTIVNNVADEGTALTLIPGTENVSITNSVIAHNIGDFCGGISSEFEAIIHMENVVLWNNQSIDYLMFYPSEIIALYCDISQESFGEGVIHEDPLFVDPGNNDFRLLPGSPCIDAGNPDSLYNDIEDPDNPGYALYPAMGTIRNDMGAYGGHGYYNPDYTNIEDNEISVVNELEIYNYPNPFRLSEAGRSSVTTISFSTIEYSDNVEVAIYNIKGQKVRTLLNDRLKAGEHELTWNGKDESGSTVASGIYFTRLSTNGKTFTRKMMILK